MLNKLRTLGRLVHVGSYQPRAVRNAPCQQVVLTGEDVDLYSLPIIKCWPLDAGPYITLPPGHHQGPGYGNAELRYLPDAGLRPQHHGDALANP